MTRFENEVCDLFKYPYLFRPSAWFGKKTLRTEHRCETCLKFLFWILSSYGIEESTKPILFLKKFELYHKLHTISFRVLKFGHGIFFKTNGHSVRVFSVLREVISLLPSINRRESSAFIAFCRLIPSDSFNAFPVTEGASKLLKVKSKKIGPKI